MPAVCTRKERIENTRLTRAPAVRTAGAKRPSEARSLRRGRGTWMRAKILLAGALVWSSAASACAEDQVAPPPPGAGAGPKWQLVHEGLPGALLRVWGRN